jgi:hypothetical protein
MMALMVMVESACLHAAVTQDENGRITLPADDGTREGQLVRWEYNATRWGSYRVRLLTSPFVQMIAPTITVTIGPVSHTFDAGKPSPRFYLEKAGKVTITATLGLSKVIEGIILEPAPESDAKLEQAADGTVTLHAKDSTVHGVKARYEPKPEKNTVGFWGEPKDWVSWEFTVTTPGRFDVEVLQGCGKGNGGSEVAVKLAGQSVKFTVLDTGHFQNFVARNIGTITLDKAGSYTLEVRPITKAKAAVMDLRQVRLLPAK